MAERDDISDSGVTSLSFSPCEDFYTDFDLQDIKLDEEETRTTGSELQHKLSKLCQYLENKSDKMILQHAADLIKHYEMRITGMEATLMNMCQERINRHSQEFFTCLKSRDECSKIKTTTHRVIATVSPFSNQLQQQQQSGKTSSKEIVSVDGIAATLTAEKLFLESDRLQESGIFDDEFCEFDPIERRSTETQTDNACVFTAAAMLFEYHSDSCDAGTSSSTTSEEALSSASSGLADELHKLETIKRRIEERGSLRFQTIDDGHDRASNNVRGNKAIGKGNPRNVSNHILLAKELSYYKSQYDLLKQKLSAYEANGDLTVKKLTDALTKEHEQQNRVEYLTNRIVDMRKEMSRLEEEKCEYEEAENDARLRCQKLEVKLYALVEKKNDIQFQLQQHMRTVSYLRNTLTELEKKKNEAYQKSYEMEMLANEYEERNFELEEREMEVKYRLQTLESIVPAVILWNVLTVLKVTLPSSYLRQPPDADDKAATVLATPTESLEASTSSSSVPSYYNYYYCCSCCKALLREQNVQTWRSSVSPERKLDRKEELGQEVEYNSAGDDEEFDECGSVADDHRRNSISSAMMDLDLSLVQLDDHICITFPAFGTTTAMTTKVLLPSPSPHERRKRKRRRVQGSWRHQRSSPPPTANNEEVYMQTLQQADELITSMENDFKRKLQEMENTLNDKHWKLEECERKLATFSMTREMVNHLTEKAQNLESEIESLKLKLKVKEEEKFSWLQKEKCLLDEIEHLNSTLGEVRQNEIKTRSKLEEERNLNVECKNQIAFREKELYDLDCYYTNQIKQLENQLMRAKRETENHEVTNGELKEEVDTLENAIYELNITLNEEKDEKEKMLVKFRQEMAIKDEEINSLKRLSRDMTAVSAAQEISGLRTEIPKSTYNFSSYQQAFETSREQDERKTSDVIFSHDEQRNSHVDRASNTNECCAQVIRYGDQYTITLKSIPKDRYSNFEVIVNSHRYRLRYAYQFEEHEKTVSSFPCENDTISLTVKPVLLYEYNGGAIV